MASDRSGGERKGSKMIFQRGGKGRVREAKKGRSLSVVIIGSKMEKT